MLRSAIFVVLLGALCAPHAFAVDTAKQDFPVLPVGGDGKWAVDPLNPNKFQSWSSLLPPLPVGVILLFNFSAGLDVIEVYSQAELDNCDFTYAWPSSFARPPEVPQVSPLKTFLANPGVQYFTTSDRNACLAGVRFNITVMPNPLALNAYIVGGNQTNSKWVASPGSTRIQDWAAGTRAQQGDVLVFTIPVDRTHSVMEFASRGAFDNCDFNNAVTLSAAVTSVAGSIKYAFVRLNRTGNYYFGSNVDDNCNGDNMKFALTVTPQPTRGKNVFYVGGEALGNVWVNPSAFIDYQTWADSVIVAQSDFLVFRRPEADSRTVKILPNRVAFDACDFTYATDTTATTDNGWSVTTYELRTTGWLFFADELNCYNGQKFAIHVGLSAIIGQLPVDLIGGGLALDKYNLRTGSTNLGNLIADAFAYAGDGFSPSPVRLAVYNSGGINVGAAAGPLRAWDAINFFRGFNNKLAVKTLNGSEVWAMFENSARGYGDGPFLQISSNFHVTQVMVPGRGVVVRSVQYWGEDGQLHNFDANGKYNIATNSFIADGGDGYWMFQGKPNLLGGWAWTSLGIRETDIVPFAFINRDTSVPLSPIESRYTTLGSFLLGSLLTGPWEQLAVATWPEYKRHILHAIKEVSYAEGDPSFFSADLSELTPDDGKGQRFYSAIDDSLNAAARIGLDEGGIPNTVKGFMWSLIQKMDDYTKVAMRKAFAAGCDDSDDMNIAVKKYNEGLERVIERPDNVLDEWRTAYRIATECILRIRRKRSLLRKLMQNGVLP